MTDTPEPEAVKQFQASIRKCEFPEQSMKTMREVSAHIDALTLENRKYEAELLNWMNIANSEVNESEKLREQISTLTARLEEAENIIRYHVVAGIKRQYFAAADKGITNTEDEI